jgi:hypothetical protein
MPDLAPRRYTPSPLGFGGDVYIVPGMDPEGASPYIMAARGALGVGMEAKVTRDEIDAKLARTEARVESTMSELKAEFAKFETEMVRLGSGLTESVRAVDTRVAQMQHSLPSKGFLIGTAVSIVAVMIGLMSFGASQFGNGIMAASSSVSQAINAEKLAQESLRITNENSGRLQTISDDLRAIAMRLDADKGPPAKP